MTCSATCASGLMGAAKHTCPGALCAPRTPRGRHPLSLYNRNTTRLHYIADHKNHGQKKQGKQRSDRGTVLRQACGGEIVFRSLCPWAGYLPLIEATVRSRCDERGYLACMTRDSTCTNGYQAIKQRIQSSHMPPCHRHMVFATNLSSMFDLLLCSTPQTWAKCCLELTAVSGY